MSKVKASAGGARGYFAREWLPYLKPAFLSVGLVASLSIGTALTVCAANEKPFEPVVGNVAIIDGDTVAIGRERVRLLGIDTPETFRSRCENELMLGLKAKERLRQLLNAGRVEIQRDGIDRYRRTLARLRVGGGIDVSAVLFSEGYALAYQPGRDAKLARLQVWCPGSTKL